MPEHIPAWEMPLWRAWYARNNVGFDVEILVKMLSAMLRESDWESLRPIFCRTDDDASQQMLMDADALSAQTAYKLDAMMKLMAKQYPQFVKKPEKDK